MRDDEAELAGEAEAGGEAAAAGASVIVSLGDFVGAVAVQRHPFGHQARHFVGDEVRGGVQGRDAAEDRQRRRGRAAPAMTTPTSWPRMRSLRALAARKR